MTRRPPKDILPLIRIKLELVEKKLSDYDIDDNGCWIWRGPTRTSSTDKSANPKAYGVASFNLPGRVFRKVYAHRLAYAYHYQEEPGELLVCHSCDVPLCINPAHHFLGSHKDNMRDMHEKGRAKGQRGSDNNSATITEAEALTIVSLLPYLNNRQISRHFNGKVTDGAVSCIRSGKTWKHIPRPGMEVAA